VFNQLTEATSIHWHGLRIANAMDGVPSVTQEPIQPAKPFSWKIDLPAGHMFWARSS
jgi:FtsP/CotA-like multicopper oxidase with cupredoxin domain